MRLRHYFLAIVCSSTLGCTAIRYHDDAAKMSERRAEAFRQFDKAACAAKGGVVKGVCMFGFPSCVVSYSDAGKSCSNKSDCQGNCEVKAIFRSRVPWRPENAPPRANLAAAARASRAA